MPSFAVAGVDVGSLTTKTVIMSGDGRMLSYCIIPTGAMVKKAAPSSFNEAARLAGLQPSDIIFVVSTGYGRAGVTFSHSQITEITCHARGAHLLFPQVRNIVDIGGQDSKVIAVDEAGRVIRFAMNDKCAAGTGRWLEVMARALEVDLDEMGPLALEAKKELSISSMCTVFAESEVVSLVAEGGEKADILGGIHRSIARRVGTMVSRVGMVGPVVMTGGVAKNQAIVYWMEQVIGTKLLLPPEPQIMGALGAASIALDRCRVAEETAKAQR
ncbi:MAG: 2-hydroxyglutaryl-CoA dehydratase [Chloroflexi bacterium]|nr:2-hydroxyglutaryl-CoA dehydratase [Chloroflexota bacterium]